MTAQASIDRGRARYRRAFGGVAAAVGARAVSYLVGLVTIPVTLPYLGSERFGAWMTISALVGIASFADLGTGLALMNRVASARARNDPLDERRSFASGQALSLMIVIGLAPILVSLIYLVDWPQLMQLQGTLANEVRPALLFVTVALLLGILLGPSTAMWNGRQQTYIPNLCGGFGALVGLVGVFAAVELDLGIPALAAMTASGPVVGMTIAFGLLLLTVPESRPKRQLVSRRVIHELLTHGSSFLVLLSAIAVANNSNPIVLTTLLGPTAAAEYSVAARIYTVPSAVAGAMAMALWPALRDAETKGDLNWARSAFVRTLGLSLGIVGAFSIVAIIFGPLIVSILSQGQVQGDLMLFVAFALATMAWTVANYFSVWLNSMSIVRPQALVWLAMAAGNVILSIALTRAGGLSGVVWATALTVGLMAVPLGILASKARRARPRGMELPYVTSSIGT